MKIIVDGMPECLGGIGTLLFNMAEENRLSNGNIVFEFILPKGSAYKKILEEKGYLCYEVPSLSKLSYYYKTVKNLFKNKKYDFIWINNTSKINVILPYLAKKHSEAKVISHVHGVDMEEQGFKRIVFQFLTKMLGHKYEKLIDVPFACSHDAGQYFYGGTSFAESFTVIKNGIFSNNFKYDENIRLKIRRDLKFKDDDIVLGAVGRLTPVKNYGFLIDLIAELPERYRCIILGDGELHDELNLKIKEKCLGDRFYLLGNKGNVNDYLCAMDMFLMPSINEGMPYSLIEAQSSGLPCIVSDTISSDTNITELVTFCDLNNLENWCQSIICTGIGADRLLANQLIIEKGFSIENSYELFMQKLNRAM